MFFGHYICITLQAHLCLLVGHIFLIHLIHSVLRTMRLHHNSFRHISAFFRQDIIFNLCLHLFCYGIYYLDRVLLDNIWKISTWLTHSLRRTENASFSFSLFLHYSFKVSIHRKIWQPKISSFLYGYLFYYSLTEQGDSIHYSFKEFKKYIV